jgi:hypothetical protein
VIDRFGVSERQDNLRLAWSHAQGVEPGSGSGFSIPSMAKPSY